MVIDKDGTQFMEVLGCGMLRPIVLQNCNIDSNKYTAIAAGIGIERMAMLKYGIDDVREFFKGDLKWLEEWSFDSNLI
jgi:phenylalanyl-tRNA synthetase alpha chain